jgi:TonB family protein
LRRPRAPALLLASFFAVNFSPVAVFLFAATTAALAVPPTSPNSSTIKSRSASSSRSTFSSAAALATAAENTTRNTQFYVVQAEINVDAKGWPAHVKLLNPTGDEWVDRQLTQTLKRSRFTPPKGSAEPTAGTFTVTVRVQVDS